MSTPQAYITQAEYERRQLIDEATAKVSATEKALTSAKADRRNKMNNVGASTRETVDEARVAYSAANAAYRVALDANCEAMDQLESLEYANSNAEVANVE